MKSRKKKTEVLSVRRYKAGYEVREELVHYHGSPPFVMKSAYTPRGSLIGDPKTARALVVKHGIAPQLRPGNKKICSIGFCERKQEWFGWSHRGACGFGIGDKVFQERFGTDKTPFKKHGKKPIKTLKDARVAAERFAAYLS